MLKDKLPDTVKDVSDVQDAVPVLEEYSKGGNKSVYEVWGKRYLVLASHVGYDDTGYASWYGEKFHGHKTSNGEIYDMYAMSAAHKHLPIPSYAKVTNLENGKTVIVRVNDRGPFHDGRIIDLSYAAAYKLDMLKKGTARVRVQGIKVYPSGSWAVPEKREDNEIVSRPMVQVEDNKTLFLQVGSFEILDGAKQTKAAVENFGLKDVRISDSDGKYRVLIGPFGSRTHADKELAILERNGFGFFWTTNNQ